jgi:hypothetical protein
MAYASTTGAENVASSAAITCGGKDAEDDRTNRSEDRSIASRLRRALDKIP